MQTFARWIATPANRPAWLAVQRVADCVSSRRLRRVVNPLFLHGPPGTGKTHLLNALVADVSRRRADLAAAVVAANDADDWLRPGDADGPARSGDLLLVEDVQHLAARHADALARLLDERLARQQQTAFTATSGPGRLAHLPARLTSRLAGGLVVGLEPLAPAGRLAFLQDLAQRRQLAVGPDVLAWLAEHLGGSGRQLEGALARLEKLAKLYPGVPDVRAVAEHFRAEADAARPTVEHIARRVGRYFRVPPRDLQSRRRGRHALVPRQVGMYLARRLTPLSLGQIGAYFGGRDHSTVLHACRKVERALEADAVLSGAVRQLHADLS